MLVYVYHDFAWYARKIYKKGCNEGSIDPKSQPCVKIIKKLVSADPRELVHLQATGQGEHIGKLPQLGDFSVLDPAECYAADGKLGGWKLEAFP